jgi:hypothetical protein
MYLPERHKIEIVDVFREPKRALEERILMTPALVKLGQPRQEESSALSAKPSWSSRL